MHRDEWDQLDTLEAEKKRIDVWWWDDASSRLCLLLAHIITRSEPWRKASIRVLAPSLEKSPDDVLADLHQKLQDARIDAEPEVINGNQTAAISSYSSDAALVLFPFRLQGDTPLDPNGNPLDELFSGLHSAACVLAAEDIDLDAEPEEGKAGETAEALDDLADAEIQVKELEKAAVKAAAAANEAKDNLHAMMQNADETQVDGSQIAEVKKLVKEAEKQAQKASRRAAKAKAKATAAAQEVEALGVTPPDAAKETKKEAE
jgi:hypothetical protein